MSDPRYRVKERPQTYHEEMRNSMNIAAEVVSLCGRLQLAIPFFLQSGCHFKEAGVERIMMKVKVMICDDDW